MSSITDPTAFQLHPSIYTLLMIDAGAIEVMRRCPEGHVVEFIGRNADVDTKIRPCATRSGAVICLVCGWIESIQGGN